MIDKNVKIILLAFILTIWEGIKILFIYILALILAMILVLGILKIAETHILFFTIFVISFVVFLIFFALIVCTIEKAKEIKNRK